MLRTLLCVVAAVLLLWSVGCDDIAVSPEPQEGTPVVTDETTLEKDAEKAVTEGFLTAAFGEPVPGLPGALLARFEAGKEEFEEEEAPEEGLGPVFNDVSCAACHDQGAVGGAGTLVETRFGKRNADGSFDPLAQFGGSLIQSQGIAYNGCSQPPEQVPAAANVTAGRQTTPLFGLGLLDAVPESALYALADPFDRNRDGISGKANVVLSPVTHRNEVGRFGWKAQVSSVLMFAGDAYLNEMGITSNLFPTENAPSGRPPVCDDGKSDLEPEDEDADGDGMGDGVEGFADFMRFLAPPPTAGNPSAAVIRGSSVFVGAKCAACHTPSLTTGDVRGIPALSRRRFYPFTDLLLHDMGALGDGIEQGRAKGSEMRTPPLWGLRVSAPYLHDGRARSIADAIRAHDGEAARSRELFQRLSPGQRSDLLAFLGYL